MANFRKFTEIEEKQTDPKLVQKVEDDILKDEDKIKKEEESKTDVDIYNIEKGKKVTQNDNK